MALSPGPIEIASRYGIAKPRLGVSTHRRSPDDRLRRRDGRVHLDAIVAGDRQTQYLALSRAANQPAGAVAQGHRPPSDLRASERLSLAKELKYCHRPRHVYG